MKSNRNIETAWRSSFVQQLSTNLNNPTKDLVQSASEQIVMSHSTHDKSFRPRQVISFPVNRLQSHCTRVTEVHEHFKFIKEKWVCESVKRLMKNTPVDFSSVIHWAQTAPVLNKEVERNMIARLSPLFAPLRSRSIVVCHARFCQSPQLEKCAAQFRNFACVFCTFLTWTLP